MCILKIDVINPFLTPTDQGRMPNDANFGLKYIKCDLCLWTMSPSFTKPSLTVFYYPTLVKIHISMLMCWRLKFSWLNDWRIRCGWIVGLRLYSLLDHGRWSICMAFSTIVCLLLSYLLDITREDSWWAGIEGRVWYGCACWGGSKYTISSRRPKNSRFCRLFLL